MAAAAAAASTVVVVVVAAAAAAAVVVDNNNNDNYNDDDDDDNNDIGGRHSRLFTIFSLRRKLSATRALKRPGRKPALITIATHRVLITRNTSCTTWYDGTGQLSSLT